MAEGAEHQQLGSYAELFGNPRWRRNAIVGVLMAFAGVVGLWGIGFFSYDLISSVLRKQFEAKGMSAKDISANLLFWTGITSIVQNIGGFLGIWAYSRITPHIGRRPAFAIAFVLAMVSTGLVFWNLDTFAEIFWMVPIMGFCQLALFGGYAIYFPELFPTRCAAPAHRSATTWAGSWRRPGLRCWDCSPRGCFKTRPNRCDTRESRCAASSCWGYSCCPSRPKPTASRCRSEYDLWLAALAARQDSCRCEPCNAGHLIEVGIMTCQLRYSMVLHDRDGQCVTTEQAAGLTDHGGPCDVPRRDRSKLHTQSNNFIDCLPVFRKLP